MTSPDFDEQIQRRGTHSVKWDMMEKLYGVKLAFRADPSYHVENFKIVNASTGEEYR